MAPALMALGGWWDADWFSPELMGDATVVGFSLPKLAGLRRQNFTVTERSAAARRSRAKKDAVPDIAPRRMAGKVALILDRYWATQAVACCRSRFLFETGPVVFFAEIPSGRLKPRSATALRRALIDIGVQGCVVRLQTASATLMLWSAAETEITQFVAAALPDQTSHPDFLKITRPGPTKPGAVRSGGASDRREAELLQQVAALRQQVEGLTHARSAVGAMEQLGLDDVRLKAMLRLLHPDKHGGSEAAGEAAKWLNNLRDLLKQKNA